MKQGSQDLSHIVTIKNLDLDVESEDSKKFD